MTEAPPPESYRDLLRAALDEDIGPGDVTVEALLPEPLRVRASIVAKATGVAAGVPAAVEVFRLLDPEIEADVRVGEGDGVSPGTVLVRLEGDARAILSAERTALNLLGRLCGIATFTAAFVAAVEGTKARVLETRKTAPGLRALDKYAVRCGGGSNHRMGLYDQVLLKENHLAAARGVGRRAIDTVVRQVREAAPEGTFLGVEVEDLGQLHLALEAGADMILLDEFSLDDMKLAVEIRDGWPGEHRPELEASGGITLENVAAAAATGVDRISIGALTHSAPGLDLSLRVEAP